MGTARFIHGNALGIDYTPSGAVTAGDVVVQSDLIGVASADIAASALGSLQVVGPLGVWQFPKTAGTSTALHVGDVVWWDAGNVVVTETASTHKILGKVAKAATDSATTVWVMGVQQKTP